VNGADRKGRFLTHHFNIGGTGGDIFAPRIPGQ